MAIKRPREETKNPASTAAGGSCSSLATAEPGSMVIKRPRTETKKPASATARGICSSLATAEPGSMAIKRPRTETKKPASAAAGGSCSSLTMAGPGVGANRIQPPPPLPPGVYFSPTKEECLRLLNRSIAGHSVLPGYIFPANVYGESPDALRQRHPPASTREGDHTWWFLSEARFQSTTSSTKRADRRVGTVGNWHMEQTKKRLDDADGLENCFGFYTGRRSTGKTAWLMQEFTSAKDDGAGKPGVPALYRVYVSPRATDDQLRDIYGKDGVKKWPNGRKKPARAMVPEEYFHAVTALLPQGSARGEDVQLPQAPPPPPPPPAYLGQYQQQQEQYLGQYYHQQQHELYLMGAAPPVDIFGQYQQQQEPFFGVAPLLPPPASSDLLNEVAADASLDNLSMSMAEFTRMLNGQPAVMANEEQPAAMANEEQPAAMANEEQPPEILKEEEPNWESLGDIVGADEFASFNRGVFGRYSWC